MKTSESIVNLSKALLTAQRKMGAATKGSSNPYFKSKYADLGSVMEATKPELNEVGVLILQPPVEKNGKNYIETTLIHAETGEFMTSETEVICSKQNDPQSFVAAQTYARRAGLQAMTFTPAEDDDGNTAAGRSAPAKVAPTPVKVPASVAEVKKAVEAATPPAAKEAAAATTEAAQAFKSSSFKKPKKAPVAESVSIPTQTEEGWN